MKQADEFLVKEWEQAWTQSRHLETMRSQYLGFFFTAVLGVLVVAGPRFATGKLTSGELLALAGLSLGLQFLSAVLFLAVRRMNDVLVHYTKRIRELTAEIKTGMQITDVNRGTVAPGPENWVGPTSRMASTSGSSQVVPAAGVVTFALALACLLVHALSRTTTSWVVDALLAAALAIGLFLAWICRPRSIDAGRGPTGR